VLEGAVREARPGSGGPAFDIPSGAADGGYALQGDRRAGPVAGYA